ncbi:hypothetical protein RSAG8_12684, partial [Rhizoctonia solani AG-8 WAC10335]
MLVSTEHITTVDNKPWGWFCNECLKAINSDRLPALALANRMWIGKIPPALMDLTVPEQILVSIYHPRCYVYKLHPRDLWSTDGSSAVHQNKLRGNVTTYELNMPDIIRMVKGTLIPHPTRILSSLIVVSLIGAGLVPKSWLKRTFSVRRQVVHAAIHCLKYTTCHPGYQNIEISDIALTNLPVDAVPDEIIATIQYEPDLKKAQRESESYYQNNLPVESNVPQVHNSINTGISNLADNANTSICDAAITDNETGMSGSMTEFILVYILTVCAVSTDLSKVSTEELFLYGLANGSRKEGKEGGYAKQQALNAARTQTRCKDFDCAAKAWTELKQDDFDEAAESEKRGVPITNPRILLLKRFLTAAGAKVMGSDASRAAYQSQIWSTMLVKNPPSLWVTINPNNLHDPVVQVLAGEKIDMDNFVATMGPDRQKCTENITEDPYACTQYFHYIINLVLEQLFSISSHGWKVHLQR